MLAWQVIDTPLLRDLVHHFESGEDEELFSDEDYDEDEDGSYEEDEGEDDIRAWAEDNAHKYLDEDEDGREARQDSGDEDEDGSYLDADEDEDEDEDLEDEDEEFEVEYAHNHPDTGPVDTGTVVLSPVAPGAGVLDDEDLDDVCDLPEDTEDEDRAKAKKDPGWTEELEDQIEAIQSQLATPRVSRTHQHREEVRRTGKSSYAAARELEAAHQRKRSAPTRTSAREQRGAPPRHPVTPARSKSRLQDRQRPSKSPGAGAGRRPAPIRQRSAAPATPHAYRTPVKPKRNRQPPRTEPPNRRQPRTEARSAKPAQRLQRRR